MMHANDSRSVLRGTPHAGGFSLIEMLLGITVFATVAVVLGNHITTSYSATKAQQDRVFAYTKAQAILSEIHAYVDSGQIGAAVDLDVLDDGVASRPQLTVTRDTNGLLPPAHPVSGNIERRGDWVWSRRITVRPFAGQDNRNVRYVTVRIYKRDGAGVQRELASLSSVVNSIGNAFPTTQEFDVYLLAIENIPGWWVYMEAIIPFVESAITDLEGRNPGLSLRTHWITKAGFGRSPLYRPTTNEAVDSHGATPDVYVYPGRMPDGNASTYYYVPTLIDGRLAIDGADANGYDADRNPYPYTLADFYNHCMRYPAAKEYHDARVARIERLERDILAAELAGLPPPARFDDMSKEPPLQILLNDMATDPDRYQNALVVNLHGELLPVPALDNVSAPAKAPDPAFGLPELRVVSHFEQLRTERPGTASPEVVRLRVYSWLSEPNDPPAWFNANLADAASAGKIPAPAALEVRILDLDLTDPSNSARLDASLARVMMMEGGVRTAGSPGAPTPYAPGFAFAPADSDDPSRYGAGEMCYEASFVDPGPGQRKYTRILLWNSPVVAPLVSDGGFDRGLDATRSARLYGMEYVPCPVGSAAFATGRDLGASGFGTKNTARWQVLISPGVFASSRFVDPDGSRYDPLSSPATADVTLTAQTSIFLPDRRTGLPGQARAVAGPLETGIFPHGTESRYVDPENLSETYTWWADSPEDVPFVERSQFLGDPRHMPYEDLLDGAADFPNRYNWFHDNLTSSQAGWGDARGDFPGLTRLWDKWRDVRMDVPRFMELYRTALARSRAIYTTLTGYSYYYIGVGNEIGYDAANGYSNSIPTTMTPWGGSGTGFVNNITGRRAFVANQVSGADWVGLPWLGELYPDASWTDFATVAAGETSPRGNLPVGSSGAGVFVRQEDRTAYLNSIYEAHGTDLWRSFQRLAGHGCVSFFNNGTSTSHFNHHFTSGNGNATATGLEIAENYGFPIPTATEVTRPFSLDTGGNVPPEFTTPEYTGDRFSARLLETFYTHGSGRIGSGLVELTDPSGSTAAAVVVNGLAQTTQTGTSVIAKYCLLSMLHAYFELGDTSLPFRIQMPARCQILAPTEITELRDPASIDLQWNIGWVRWDGQPYTATTGASFAESESQLEYVLMYSRDNGQTWMYVQNNQPAVPGRIPDDLTLRVADMSIGDETYTWPTPAVDFPEGTYLLRIETYRTGQALHYSLHQSRFFIER